MEKFRFRFSYWLLIGILGFILQIVAFFMFGDYLSSVSSVTSTTTASSFWAMNANLFMLMASCILVGTMFMGYFVSKKDQKSALYNISTIGGAVSQLLIIAMCVSYLIFASINRTKMFSEANNQKIIQTFMMIRVASMLISSAFMMIFVSTLFKVKNNNTKVGRFSYYFNIATNAIFFILLFTTMIMSVNTKAYDFLTKYIHMIGSSVKPPYATSYAYFNGFSLTQLKIQSTTINECKTYISLGKDYSYLVGPAVIALITEITYLFNILSNIFFATVQTVESFDLDRDEDRNHI
jgi:hypothetical protein